jgi:hypothetical protein
LSLFLTGKNEKNTNYAQMGYEEYMQTFYNVDNKLLERVYEITVL